MSFEALRRFFAPWAQESLLYEVTERCNLQCPHCYNVWKNDDSLPPQEPRELSTDQSLRLIDKAIRESRCRRFAFTGGEPLLREDLEILVRHAASRCEHVTLITNGTLLTGERVQSLIKAGVALFELPLNAGNRVGHNHMAGGIDCFDRVTRAAVEIRSRGAELAFVFVGTSLNIEGWKDALDLGMALGARLFLFNRYNAGGKSRHRPETLLPSVEQVREGLRVAENYAEKYGLGIGASIAIPPCLINPEDFPHVGFGFCAVGTNRAYYTLDAIGRLRPCNHSPTILGNVLETPLRIILRSETLRSFQRARPAFCSGCQLEGECLGGCKAAAEVCYGSLTACDPFLELNRHLSRRPA